MIVKLTTPLRIVAASLMRTKKDTDDIHVMLAWKKRASEVELSIEEKKAIKWTVTDRVPAYEESEPPKEYDVELSVEEIDYLIDQINEMVQKGKVSAASENILGLYERLEAVPR